MTSLEIPRRRLRGNHPRSSAPFPSLAAYPSPLPICWFPLSSFITPLSLSLFSFLLPYTLPVFVSPAYPSPCLCFSCLSLSLSSFLLPLLLSLSLLIPSIPFPFSVYPLLLLSLIFTYPSLPLSLSPLKPLRLLLRRPRAETTKGLRRGQIYTIITHRNRTEEEDGDGGDGGGAGDGEEGGGEGVKRNLSRW